ncbi:hypothetical protein JM18_009235 [Phytophthora kernoviae]|uniref:U-box domain-containing protein n=2 Tax=Phytophthora kernoviae TaxID=325452 RepID=A0A921V365_9STRA|nr:hypothetical protein G195_011000 [Phytophthora kernoviae 00238/432]KAG2508211.1 hypothetical protein JM18_009235 [Phytophthora kernoviae]
MLDGYVAINSKQLRLTLRLLLEALELTSWLASIASVEQAARTLSFLVASLANAHEEKEWTFSHPLLEDGKLLLAHLIVLVVRYAGHNAVRSSTSSCSPSSFWKIVRASGDIMERRVGDLDTQVRWGLNALCTRIESESYLGSTSLDEDDGDDEMCVAGEEEARELDEDEALALLEKQAASTASFTSDGVAAKRLGKRFIATLAKDGRFDFRVFVGGCRFLRPSRNQDGSSSESDSDEEPLSIEDGYLYLDDSWVQQFVRAMQEADEMIHVQEAMEACLGDIPDQYLDPLLSTLMTDPVRLPSGNVVDRAVIARHLLASSQQGGSTGRDPFTREPLTMAMVEPCDALRLEIQLYLRTKMRHFRKTAREDVLATWGLGWDVLFDSSSSDTEAEADSEDGAEAPSPMESPSKSEKLVPEDQMELGHDGLPREIWEDMAKNERKIFYMFMFLNASVLWAYYSCLSAQDFYAVEFADSGLDFSFLTTLCTSWPMVIGHALQIFFGYDKKLKRGFRVHVGYGVFLIVAILIMVFSAINFSNQKTGAILVLVCFGIVGFGNSLTEATYYTFAALFPINKFSQAVQIGNGMAGVFNITLATILRLAVGGVDQTSSSTKLSFYLFFGILIIVLIVALVVYNRLANLPCVKYLTERNEESCEAENLAQQSIGQTFRNLWRIFCIIWMPALAQFLVLFVSLSVYPGFGCAAARNLEPPYANVVHTDTKNWYCAPGIVGSYNYGDFFGRALTGAALYKLLNSKWCLSLSIVRLAFIPLLLMGVAGTSLYSFGYDDMGAIVYNIVLNLIIGLTNGFLSTVTMGVAPRMLKPEDRESGGAVMVLCLFLGIAAGSTVGFLFSDQGWLGL